MRLMIFGSGGSRRSGSSGDGSFGTFFGGVRRGFGFGFGRRRGARRGGARRGTGCAEPYRTEASVGELLGGSVGCARGGAGGRCSSTAGTWLSVPVGRAWIAFQIGSNS